MVHLDHLDHQDCQDNPEETFRHHGPVDILGREQIKDQILDRQDPQGQNQSQSQSIHSIRCTDTILATRSPNQQSIL